MGNQTTQKYDFIWWRYQAHSAQDEKQNYFSFAKYNIFFQREKREHAFINKTKGKGITTRDTINQ